MDNCWQTKQSRPIQNKRRNARAVVKVLDQVEVLFPFAEPYQCQIMMMESVVQCIKESKNGLIESPTGTGKTMSLLCAAIACLQQERQQNLGQMSKIIYCTRTHSQIEQIFSEIKSKLPYTLHVTPFASRKHSCVFEDLPEKFPGHALNLSCKLLRKLNSVKKKLDNTTVLKLKSTGTKDIEDTTVVKSGCPYFYGLDDQSKQQEDMNNFVNSKVPWDVPLSVSDFHKIGQINQFCPYYLMRQRLQQSDVCILPYNYVLDSDLRSQINLDLRNSVIIFDEGHNIHGQCEELFQFEFCVNDLFACYTVLNQIWAELQSEEQFLNDYTRYQLKGQRIDTKACAVFVLKIIDVLESFNTCKMDNKIVNKQFPASMNVYKLPELFSFFALVFGRLKDEKDFMMEKIRRCNGQYQDGQHVKLNDPEGLLDRQEEFCFRDKLTLFIEILELCITESGDKAKCLNKLYDCLVKTRVCYDHYSSKLGDEQDDKKCYYDFYVCIMDDIAAFGPGVPQANKRKLGVWCFNPSFCFSVIEKQNPRSVIFASGTLAPLHAFACEMEQEFPIRLENSHVIQSSQVMCAVLTHDTTGKEINFSYKQREDTNFYIQLSQSLIRLFSKIRGGVLIFVPAYSVLVKIKKVWRSQKIFKQFDREVFVEDQNQTKNQSLFQEYLETVRKKGRAAFIAVCRGKLAEGIDFVDDAARCVVMCGIPYPQIFDPKVMIKRDYLDKKKKSGQQMIDGNEWYKLQAQRAVNQAIGRVIRHVSDYGSIILMDSRFQTNNIQVSKWLESQKKVYSDFSMLETDVDNFFRLNCPNWYEHQPNCANEFKKKRAIKCQKEVDPKLKISYEYESESNLFSTKFTSRSSNSRYMDDDGEFTAAKLDFEPDVQTATTTPNKISKLDFTKVAYKRKRYSKR